MRSTRVTRAQSGVAEYFMTLANSDTPAGIDRTDTPGAVQQGGSGDTAARQVHVAMPLDVVGHAVDAGVISMCAVSFRGTAHLAFGEPRQDAFSISCNSEWAIAVVSDGIGSCKNSHYGSAAAAEAVTEGISSGRIDPHDSTAVLSAASAACMRVAAGLDVDANSVSATLTVAVVERIERPDGHRRAVLHAVGDSPAVLLDTEEGLWSYITPVDDGPSNVVRGWIPDHHGEVFSVGLVLPPGSVLVLASDGFTTPLGDGSGPLGTDLALRWGQGARKLFPFMVDLSFDAYHDDKTVVALWNNRPRIVEEIRDSFESAKNDAGA